MENWTQRLENIDRKFTAAYDKSPKFDLLGKSSDELSKIEKASFHRDLVRTFCKKLIKLVVKPGHRKQNKSLKN